MNLIKISYLLIFLITFYFFNSCFFLSQSSKVSYRNSSPSYPHTIYIFKSYWHTGIIIKNDTNSNKRIKALKLFKNYEYSDIGWGDEDFYQTPGFNIYYATKAILIPTNSVIRIEGHGLPIEDLISTSDYCIKLFLSEKEFEKLCFFINNSLDENNQRRLIITSTIGTFSPEVTSDEARRKDSINIIHNESKDISNATEKSQIDETRVIFFKSRYKYHLFRTCNTWVAMALSKAGLDVSDFLVITSDDLYSKIYRLGIVLKENK